MSQPITMLAKEAVQKAFETTLEEGVFLERRLFMSTFATSDKMEGMDAFVAKRKAEWKDE
jgi:enoyl-CoA hydratase